MQSFILERILFEKKKKKNITLRNKRHTEIVVTIKQKNKKECSAKAEQKAVQRSQSKQNK